MDTSRNPNQRGSEGGGIGLVPIVIFGVAIIAISAFIVWGWNLPALILPEQASAEAQRTDALFNVLLFLGSIVFFLVQGLLYYSAVRFRAAPNDTSDGPPIHGNSMLEIVWTLIPTVIVFALGAWSWATWNENIAASPSELINVVEGEPIPISSVGQRYQWSFQYDTNERNINDEQIIINSGALHIYIPEAGSNREFLLDMTTEDVIHSFWVPVLRVKQDLLPGRVTQVRFTPIESDTGFEFVGVSAPAAVYASPDDGGEVLFTLPAPEEGAITMPVEMELVNRTAEISGWVEVITPEGDQGFINAEAITGRFNKYRLICTELCGGGHGEMFTWTYIYENEDVFLDSWYTPNVEMLRVPPDNPIALGEQVLSSGKYPCAGCHMLDTFPDWAGASGPNLSGIGSRAGERADEAGLDSAAAYLAHSLRYPNEYLVPGYQGQMPQFTPEDMPQEDLVGIVAFLCTQEAGADTDCDLNGDDEGNNFDEAGNLIDVDAAVEYLRSVAEEIQGQ